MPSFKIKKMNTYYTLPENDFNLIIENFKFLIKEIDVRSMEMPMPMITIVNELQLLQPNNALLVTHHKIPQILLNDLNDGNLTIYLSTIETNLIKLFFIKS